MLHGLQRKLDTIWQKNGEEIRAILTGNMPYSLKGSPPQQNTKTEIPVFCFHPVEPKRFEKQLQFLAANGYSTVDSDPLFEILKEGCGNKHKTVVLTFDDATGSFWATAFPLLKKYGFNSILFAIPGLVPEDNQIYPNLEDVWGGRTTLEEIVHREHMQPLCTWSELLTMHQSGIVDIQSHSLTHSRINISPKIVDFIHPGFDTYFYENINVPISRDDDIERPLRQIRFGEPVYESASRFSGSPRFLEDPYVGQRLVDYVVENGGRAFFRRSSWRRELKRKYRDLVGRLEIETEYESALETEAAIRSELTRSKYLLESRLPGKIIHHFCYPWFQGSPVSDRIARECGYQSVFYGLDIGEDNNKYRELPFRICRISEEYLFCLSGRQRHSMFSVWTAKILHFVKRSASGN
jgi:peptidoglycan/xylan/chitin deacetylase (PgdA/CDA1 family)